MAQVEEKRKKKQLEQEQRKWEEQEEEQRLAREKEQMQKQFEEDMLKQKQKEVAFCIFFSADSCNNSGFWERWFFFTFKIVSPCHFENEHYLKFRHLKPKSVSSINKLTTPYKFKAGFGFFLDKGLFRKRNDKNWEKLNCSYK